MSRKILFIVNTPFHLLTAFILAKGKFNRDRVYLALVHPHGYDRWAENPVLKYMASTECGYAEVFPLGNCWSSRHKELSFRQQTSQIKKMIGTLQMDDVFLGSDIDPQNQLLVAAIEKTTFYRYEDGLYSYYNEDRRRSIVDQYFHKFKIKLIEWMAGISGNLYINTATASDSRAGIGDYMYYPELLQRYSPDAKEITKEMIDIALCDLESRRLMPVEIKIPSILYLSQPLVEQKKISLEEEFSLLKEVVNCLGEGQQLLYKPHPNDSAYKLDFYSEKLPEMKQYLSLKPVELVFASEAQVQGVISYQSTALLTAGKFSKRSLSVISLAGFYRDELHPVYIKIMKAAGVRFPMEREELQTSVKSL